MPPLLLDDDEAVAVAVGLRSAASGTVVGLGEASPRALTKLEQLLPGRLRGMVAALLGATVPLAAAAATVELEALVTIAAASRACERVRFRYRDRGGRPSSRSVEPHRLVQAGHRWYLVARDLDQQEWRTFRVDRIEDAVATGWRFTPADPPDAATFVAEAVTAAPYRYRARVRLRAPVRVVAELVPPTVGVLEAVDETTCVLTAGSDSLDATAVHLALLGVDFEVLEPPELIDHVRGLADRLGRAVS